MHNRPCPNCGTDKHLRITEDEESGYILACENCRDAGCMAYWGKWPSEALAAWNYFNGRSESFR